MKKNQRVSKLAGKSKCIVIISIFKIDINSSYMVVNSPKIVVEKVDISSATKGIYVQTDPPKIAGWKFHQIASTHLEGKELIITMIYTYGDR